MKVYKRNGWPVKVWADNVQLEEQALEQLYNVSELPFIFKHIAAMPDVHMGWGAAIGSVIATQGAVVPSAVGVDIGCGMSAYNTGMKSDELPKDLAGLREEIEVVIPHGGPGEVGSWKGNIPEYVRTLWEVALEDDYEKIAQKYPEIIGRNDNRANQLGTLGTGNHFIEVCLDETDTVWVMLHSGSRGCGYRIGNYFIKRAKDSMATWYIDLPDNELAYLPLKTELFKDYIRAVGWAQNYAKLSRNVMMTNVCKVVEKASPNGERPYIDCHHNYVTWENHFGSNVLVTRKGAVRARAGDVGIIPGSMGAKSFIVIGKGSQDSFMSCSHGAGRAMSRTKARKTFTVAEHAKATEGVECSKDDSVLDETPGAYKDIDAVMKAQSDLVEIKHTLKQIICVKG